VLVQPHQQLGIHPRHQLHRRPDGAVLARCVQRQAQQQGGDVLVVRLAPAEHGQQPVVDGGRTPPPAVHRQLRPQREPRIGVAPQVAGQRPFDEPGIGAFAVDQEELAAIPGGAERLPLDVGGLAGAAGADDQPRPPLHQSGDHDQAALVGPAEIAVDLHAQGDRTEVVVTHRGGATHSDVHAQLGLALGSLDLGRVDRLAAAGQVQRGGKQPDWDGQGKLRPYEGTRGREVDDRGANLPQPAGIAREVMSQRRGRPALVSDHRSEGGQGGEREFPPAQPGHPQQRLAGRPREERHRAEQEQGDGHAHRQLPLGGWATGRQPVAKLVVIQRPGRMAPAPERLVAAPAGIVRRPAAPATRVLGMPAHRPPP
jgi:hypothetical protein